MIGPPGGGKTMLAQRLPTILPKLLQQESTAGPSDFLTGTVDDARIYSYPPSEAEIKALYASRGPGPAEN